ncbi:hypothetical protein PVAP13_2KG240600 [Panicum virgatum]|uniref:Uncharacterized protein n=1 Tax=Panicum virgatum TaxID=38727 RepID=A0A8T0W2I1_PANVG|nr:hypothetical protein PVAP13_2KG240600 [Panicum virgatum]
MRSPEPDGRLRPPTAATPPRMTGLLPTPPSPPLRSPSSIQGQSPRVNKKANLGEIHEWSHSSPGFLLQLTAAIWLLRR